MSQSRIITIQLGDYRQGMFRVAPSRAQKRWANVW